MKAIDSTSSLKPGDVVICAKDMIDREKTRAQSEMFRKLGMGKAAPMLTFTWRFYGCVVKVHNANRMEVVDLPSVMENEAMLRTINVLDFDVQLLDEEEYPEGIFQLRMAAIMKGLVSLS